MLPKTIESVINQSYSDWELIIVDDGSTDHTKELVASFIEKDARIKYIYQENAERSAARNNGIENASGEYICFLDSDDRFLSHHLEVLNKNIHHNQMPVAFYFTGVFSKKDDFTQEIITPKLQKPFINYFLTNAIIPARVCIHKNILIDTRFDEDITIVEDVLLWTKITFRFPAIQILDYTVEYLLHEDNSVSIKKNGAVKRLEGLLIFFKRYPDISQQITSKLKTKLIYDTKFNIVKHMIYNGLRFKPFFILLQLLIAKPTDDQFRYKLNILFNLLFNFKKCKSLIES